MAEPPSKSGRVRKKSAKVLEMEEAEEIEKIVAKQPKAKTPAPSKKTKKDSPATGTPSPGGGIPPGSATVRSLLNSERENSLEALKAQLSKGGILTEQGMASDQSSLPPPPPSKKARKSVKIEAPLSPEVPAEVKEEDEIKTEETSMEVDDIGVGPMIPLKVEGVGGDTEEEEDDEDGSDVSMSDDEGGYVDEEEEEEEEAPLIIDTQPAKKSKKSKKVKKEPTHEPATEKSKVKKKEKKKSHKKKNNSKSIEVHESDKENRKCKSKEKKRVGKKKSNSKVKAEKGAFTADSPSDKKALTVKINLKVLKAASAPGAGGDGPTYSNVDEMVAKLQTSDEKKSKKKKSKKSKKDEDPEKEKKKRGPTAYMLWCNSMRPNVVHENPTLDFGSISKRLGEIWQALSDKEKMSWKKKAKKVAMKQSGQTGLISTGKTPASKTVVTPLGMKPKPPSAAPGIALAGPAGGDSLVSDVQSLTSTSLVPVPVPGTSGRLAAPEDMYMYKVSGTTPVDAAAHLKLLGESLTIIGARLQEHQGQIAVQGSLSVLLDSLVCSLGPLLCLTNQIPELNGCDGDTHSQTLDNIAYFMPGIG